MDTIQPSVFCVVFFSKVYIYQRFSSMFIIFPGVPQTSWNLLPRRWSQSSTETLCCSMANSILLLPSRTPPESSTETHSPRKSTQLHRGIQLAPEEHLVQKPEGQVYDQRQDIYCKLQPQKVWDQSRKAFLRITSAKRQMR